MSTPSAEEQLRFLTNLQRLLAEGSFVATYKYALLLALAEIAIEHGVEDDGAALPVSTKLIAEKYIQFYWRQCLPYLPRGQDAALGLVLRQNTGRQAAILMRIIEARETCGGSLSAARRDHQAWNVLVNEVAAVVRQMPLWKLQTVGGSQLDFLYENRREGTTIELRPGVAYCLRQFYGLIGDLVRGAWVRYIRRHNHDVLGTTSDLTEFLFGSERSGLTAVQPILQEIQHGRCFYCDGAFRGAAGHVDHFIPWSRYPIDLGHNFVLAHDSCNENKADHLAAVEYLAKWAERNRTYQEQLREGFEQRQVLHDLPTSISVARWAYGQASDANGLVWVRAKEMAPLQAGWEKSLAGL